MLGLLPAALLAPAAARADVPYVHDGFVYRSITSARYNPLGLSSWLRVGYWRPLLGDQENILLQRTYVGLNALTMITPSFGRMGLRADFQPLAFLQILIAYEFMGWFGTFGSMQSYRDISADFGESAQAARERAHQHRATTAGVFTADVVLQGKAGPILFQSDTAFVHNHVSVGEGDEVYYDLVYNMLSPRDGWLISNETDVLYKTTWGFAFGVRNGMTHAFYPAAAVAGNAARAAEITPIDYFGGLFLYELYERKRPARVNMPAVFLMTAFWLRDPYRTGRETSPLLPFLAAGFTATGDL